MRGPGRSTSKRSRTDPVWTLGNVEDRYRWLDISRLEQLENSIIDGTHPHNARVLLREQLFPYYQDQWARWCENRPDSCCTMKVVERWGRSSLQKNENYSNGNHRAMSQDVVRVQAYAAAIGRAAGGKRVLDVGTGPFMLLGRLAHAAGAEFVSCVEHSESSVEMACALLEAEYLQLDRRRVPVLHAHDDCTRKAARQAAPVPARRRLAAASPPPPSVSPTSLRVDSQRVESTRCACAVGLFTTARSA